METTAEYSRFRSMGKKDIEEKERTGKKQRKGKEHHRRKGQKKGRGYDKKEQVPPQGKTRGYSGKETHRMPMETTAEYSRFRSMGKKGIEEKERNKERKGKERKGTS